MVSPPDALAGRRFWLAAVAVIVLASGLRATGLGRWSFSSDELGTFNDVAMFLDPPKPIVHPDQAVPRVIPLAMLALDAGHRAFGRDEFGCRLVVAIFGVLHIAVVVVGLSRVLPRGVALTAGLWLTVSVEHIFYSQYHRFYTLAALLAAAAMLAGARSVRTGSGWWMAAACALAGFGVAVHTLTGAVFGVLLVGGIVAAIEGKRRPLIVAAGGAALAAGAFVLVIMPVIGAKAGLTSWTGLTPLHAVFGAVMQASWPVCVLAVPGAVVLWRRDRAQAAFWFGALAVWAGAAVVLPKVLPYHSAYIFPLALPAFVLAAVAVAELAAAVRLRRNRGRRARLDWVTAAEPAGAGELLPGRQPPRLPRRVRVCGRPHRTGRPRAVERTGQDRALPTATGFATPSARANGRAGGRACRGPARRKTVGGVLRRSRRV